jgi:hypothetical protein
LGVGREAGYHFPVAAHQELLEVPQDLGFGLSFDAVSLQLFAKWNFVDADCLGLCSGESRVERVLFGSEDGDLAEQRKLDAVVERAKRLNLFTCARLLLLEVVGRKAGDNQALAAVEFVEFFEAFVLRGEAAF